MAKPKPDPRADGEAIDKREEVKRVNRAERVADRSDGHDSRTARDGGTNRRLRR